MAGRAFSRPLPYFLPFGRRLLRLGIEIERGLSVVSHALVEAAEPGLVLLHGVRLSNVSWL